MIKKKALERFNRFLFHFHAVFALFPKGGVAWNALIARA